MMIITSLFEKALNKIAVPESRIIDIGGGLRISKKRGDRYDSSNKWIESLISKINYQILDPVDTYNPDIIGDIHELPFKDDSIDAIICLSILEHIENPSLACQEMYRSVKPGGAVFLYLPFLFYYHAEEGYYKDYWRFSRDAIELLLKNFSTVEIEATRGAIETIFNLFPFGSKSIIRYPARFLDRLLGKVNSKQTAGYYVLAIK